MATTIVNADFAVPDGTLLSDYSSTPGGFWGAVTGFSPPFPPTSGATLDFSINANELQLNTSASCFVGPEDAQQVINNFSISFDLRYLNDAASLDPNIGLGFCGDTTAQHGYVLNTFYNSSGEIGYNLYRYDTGGTTVIGTVAPSALALDTPVHIDVFFDSSTGDLDIVADSVPIISYTDSSPLTGDCTAIQMAGFSTSTAVAVSNFVLTDLSISTPTPPDGKILVDAPFTGTDNQVLSAYTSVVGGQWNNNFTSFTGTFPVVGDHDSYVINGYLAQDVGTATGLQGADGGVAPLPYRYAVQADIAFANNMADPKIGFVLSGHGDAGTGYYLEAQFNHSDSDVQFVLSKFSPAGFTTLSTVAPQALAFDTSMTVRMDVDSQTGVITFGINGTTVLSYADPTPLAMGGLTAINFSPETTAPAAKIKNYWVVDTTPSNPNPTGKLAYLSPIGNTLQGLTNNGVPLAGGKLFSYFAGTTTPLATYMDPHASTANTNPIVLDSAGRVPNQIRFLEGTAVKLTLTDADGNVIWTQDNLVGINDTSGGAGVDPTVWLRTETDPVVVSDTSFSLVGNYSSIMHVGRRILLVQSGSNYYGTITGSSVTSPSAGSYLTTVVLSMDSGTVQSSVETCYYSYLDSVGSAVPVNLDLLNRVTVLEGQMAALTTAVNALTTKVNVNTPIGEIMHWPAGWVPAGWVMCNGQALSRTTYNHLYGVCGTTFGAGDGVSTFNVPNLCGVFVRGMDNGRGIDPGRTMGSWQNWQLPSHTHWSNNTSTGRNARSPDNLFMSSSGDIAKWGPRAIGYTGGTENGGESRPVNVAMNYIIYTGV